MATDKTTTLRFRCSVKAAEALVRDAEELASTPGTILRQMVEGRYLAPRGVAKSNKRVEESHAEQVDIEE